MDVLPMPSVVTCTIVNRPGTNWDPCASFGPHEIVFHMFERFIYINETRITYSVELVSRG
jgi:hypothetical protein